MKSPRWFNIRFISTAIAIISFLLSPALITKAQTSVLDQVRARVVETGEYRYTADVEQTLIPRAVPAMIGETDQRVDLRIDGDVLLHGWTEAAGSV